MSSSLDMPLGDLIKQNKKKAGGGGNTQKKKAGGAKQGGAIAKGAGRGQAKKAAPGGGRQAGARQAASAQGGAAKGQRKPRQQAKQTPVAAMRVQSKQQNRATTANRQTSGRASKLAQRRGLAPAASAAAPAPAAGSQPVLVYTDAKGQQIIQPVALVQQAGQAGAQVIATGAAQRSAKPLFNVANRQQKTNGQGQQRRQSGGQQQQKQGGGGNQRQANGGARGGRQSRK